MNKPNIRVEKIAARERAARLSVEVMVELSKVESRLGFGVN
jgi:hypothetical protein